MGNQRRAPVGGAPTAPGKDLARADRIYEYIRTLDDARKIPGALGADFQLIVVDNDLPRRFGQVFNTLHIDPDNPLIRLS